MASVYKKTVTKALPKSAETFTRARQEPVTLGRPGPPDFMP